MIEFNATLLVAMLSFVVFMFIMNAIFYRPILSIIKKREDYINSNYNDAKNIAQNAQEIIDEYNEKLELSKNEARKQTALKIEQVQKDEFAKIQKAKDKSKIEIQSKKEALEQDKNELKEKVDTEVVKSLVSDITYKITGKYYG